jgi:hypothetical protein
MVEKYSEKLARKFAAQVRTRCKMMGISLNELSLKLIPWETSEEKEAVRKYLSKMLNANKIPEREVLLNIGAILKFNIDDYIWDYSYVDSSRNEAYYETLGLVKNEYDDGFESITSYSNPIVAHAKYLDIGEPYETLKMTDNSMRGCYLPKNTQVIFATDGAFKEDGGLYCCIINNKKYIRLIYHNSENGTYSLASAGGYNRHLAPRFYGENDITIIGRVLGYYMIADSE